MDKFRFLKWKVYNDAKELFYFVLQLVKKLPKEHRFEISSQIIRSSLSVVLNIAEGSGKISDRELNRYFDIALGSAHETLAVADLLLGAGFISSKEFDIIYVKIKVISDQLGGFKKKLDK
ncbi:MAG: four helix bundle protein [bacterium]|nr:four helix bundle protein [bacterium]